MSSPSDNAPPSPQDSSSQETPERVLDVDPGGDTGTGGGVDRSIRQQEGEKDDAFLSFLLWCMQDPQDRSNRLIARSLGVPEPTVRYWRKRYRWRERAARVPRVEFHALRAYRERIAELPGEVQVARLSVALDAVLEEAGFTSLRREVQRQRANLPSKVGGTDPDPTPPPGGTGGGPVPTSPLTTPELDHMDVARHMRDLRERVVRDHLRPEDVRRQILLIDGVMGLIARKVQDGTLRVRVSDIPALLKARALLTGLPGEVEPSSTSVDRSQHLHQHLHVVESVRMRDARKSGDQGQVLDAMTAEVADLQVILGAIPRGGGE